MLKVSHRAVKTCLGSIKKFPDYRLTFIVGYKPVPHILKTGLVSN